MWDVRVCTACLATDVRMCSMSAASLLEPYRLLTGIELQSEGMPKKLCYECAALVHKFNMFRHKCERASLLLQDIYNQHDEVSEKDVLKINRAQHNLISSYAICQTQVYDLSSLKTKGKKRQKEKTSEVVITKNTKTSKALNKSVKVEIDIKKEIVPVEMKIEDCTEPIDDDLVEEDCSQAVQPASSQKIERVRKRRQGLKTREKKSMVSAKDFGMKEELLSQAQQMAVMRERQNTEGYKFARFHCAVCYKPFSEETAYNNHKLKHEPVSGDLICDICKMRYNTRHGLCQHITTQHMAKYSCRTCPSIFYNRSSAIKHYAWHKGILYSCHICGASFKRDTSRSSHLRIKHASDNVCGHCGDAFLTKRGLLKHVNLKHRLKRETVASGGEQETSGPYCAECDIQFTCKQAWTRHILISPKHQHERHICALGCETCGETLPDEESLGKHRVAHGRTHVGNATKPIKCEQCSEMMESSRAYHAHFTRVHPDKTRTLYPVARAPCIPFVCELCGKVFQSRAYLKQHSYKHTGERKYECDMCNKRFTTNQVLHIHIRSHTKELPYKCDICGLGFTNYFNMKRHKSVHTDATPYACDICGKHFKYRTNVKSHVKYVHMKKPWPKRDRSKKQRQNERRSVYDKATTNDSCLSALENTGIVLPASEDCKV